MQMHNIKVAGYEFAACFRGQALLDVRRWRMMEQCFPQVVWSQIHSYFQFIVLAMNMQQSYRINLTNIYSNIQYRFNVVIYDAIEWEQCWEVVSQQGIAGAIIDCMMVLAIQHLPTIGQHHIVLHFSQPIIIIIIYYLLLINTMKQFIAKYQSFQLTAKQDMMVTLTNIMEGVQSIITIIQQQAHFIGYHFSKCDATVDGVTDGITKILEALKHLKQIIETRQSVNLKLVRHLIYFLANYLLKKTFNTLSLLELAIWVIEFDTKIGCFIDFIHTSTEGHQDISEWLAKPQFMRNIIIDNLGNQQQLSDKHQFMKRALIVATAAVIEQQQHQHSLMKKIRFGLSYSKYFVNYIDSQLKSYCFYRRPTIQMAQFLWNLPQTGAMRQLSKVTYENITLKQKIYIPFEQAQPYPNIFQYNQNAICVRLLSSQKLQFFEKRNQETNYSLGKRKDIQFMDTIMIHMHGGGFIALSSASMQVYTRKWANKLHIPIFSIDYRVPPKHPFPAAPNDCYRVYSFIIKNISHYMNITPKNIIVSGDSAGGSLACSLTALAIKNKLTIPKALFLVYPSTDTRLKFTPSKLYAFNDTLLIPPILILCLKEYLVDIQNQYDPLASPVLISEQYVGGSIGDKRFPINWPHTSIFVGQKDPLFDDSLKLLQRLKSSNISHKCKIFSNFSHGFLNLGFVISECNSIIDQSANELQQILIAIKKQTQLKQQITQQELIQRNKETQHNIQINQDIKNN